MGSNDTPPPHASPYTMPTANLLLQIGVVFWTACYILLIYHSHTSKSYGMPLLALTNNLGWELVYTLFIVEQPLEKFAFGVWVFLDVFIVYFTLVYGPDEWGSNYFLGRKGGNMKWVVLGGTVGWMGIHWAFSRCWLDWRIGEKKGKWYMGVEGPDTTELAFWSVGFCQLVLSGTSLLRLRRKQNTRGVSWGIWATRFLGSLIGFHGYYVWMWWVWPEAHGYFVSPLGCVFWITGLSMDLVYAWNFWRVKEREEAARIEGQVGGSRKPKIGGKKL